jgi:23S rRNA (guanosine2251-2'-O)-methyltransferase
MKTEILFGIHPVTESLNAQRRRFTEIYIKDKPSKRLETVAAIAESYRVPVRKLSVPQLTSLSGTDMHQGICARVSPYPLAEISDMMNRSGSSPIFLLILDSIEDPHNLGALIRTGLCTGADGMIIPKNRSASPNPVVSKASAGALEHLLLAQVTNLANTMDRLKEKGLWITGMDISAEQTIFTADFTGPLAVVIGGEEKGIRPLVKTRCDFLVSIPQKGPVASLNASAAGAVAMYEVFRQRRLSNG